MLQRKMTNDYYWIGVDRCSKKCPCLKDQLGLCSLNCHTHTMTGNCSASQRVLTNSLRVVSAKRGNPSLESYVGFSITSAETRKS